VNPDSPSCALRGDEDAPREEYVRHSGMAGAAAALPNTLVLTPVSRHPVKLTGESVSTIAKQDAPVIVTGDDVSPPGPRVSIIIITHNGSVFTRLCLLSLVANTGYPNYEIIIVDNASTDDTIQYLSQLELCNQQIRVIYNDTNRGFAAANNQGLAVAEGNIFVLLNNDTIVGPGWLDRLVAHLNNPSIGLIGPVTNRIGNEAEIEVDYTTYGEFLSFAEQYTREHLGQVFEINTLCMYCLGMRRETYEQLGPLDERFGVGMLEDDDYSLRAHHGCLRVVCAEDVFVHHFGGASFGALVSTGEYTALLEANRQRFEEKWGVKWQPYNRRLSLRYLQTIDRIRQIVGRAIPAGATVLVVSKGDEELVRHEGCVGWHFPSDGNGLYAGFYPVDTAAAVRQLDVLRRKGARYLVVPHSSLWWFDYYGRLEEWLLSTGRSIWSDEDCRIFEL
jgi:GT2 family glycosyltransferase